MQPGRRARRDSGRSTRASSRTKHGRPAPGARIEHLVEDYISATRAAAQGALSRAFATGQVLAFDDARARLIALAEARDGRLTRSER
ncbi:MAG TPA: hypothetical protein VN894_06370 [Polyangiaceae bacterium]|nr:hypothetical protein [Polyangiaceae bacterium]